MTLDEMTEYMKELGGKGLRALGKGKAVAQEAAAAAQAAAPNIVEAARTGVAPSAPVAPEPVMFDSPGVGAGNSSVVRAAGTYAPPPPGTVITPPPQIASPGVMGEPVMAQPGPSAMGEPAVGTPRPGVAPAASQGVPLSTQGSNFNPEIVQPARAAPVPVPGAGATAAGPQPVAVEAPGAPKQGILSRAGSAINQKTVGVVAKGAGQVAKVAAPVIAGYNTLTTDQADYNKRFGIDTDKIENNAGRALAEAGVRTLGFASEVGRALDPTSLVTKGSYLGDKFLGHAAPELSFVDSLLRDKQREPDAPAPVFKDGVQIGGGPAGTQNAPATVGPGNTERAPEDYRWGDSVASSPLRTQLANEPGITKSIDPVTGRVTYSGKDVVSPDSPTKEQREQAQALAAKDKATLVNMIGARAAEGDREGVLRLTSGVPSPEIQAARKAGLETARTENALRALPKREQAVLRAKMEETRYNREATAAAKATENAIKSREVDIKALQLRADLQKREDDRNQRNLDNENRAQQQAGERDKTALSQLETQYGDKALAGRVFSDMNTTLAAQAQRAQGIDRSKLNDAQQKWLDMTTKRTGSGYQPKSVGDLSIVERDRLHGAQMIRAGLEAQLRSQSGLINKLTPNYWTGADGALSDDLSKFDPGNFKLEGEYVVGTGAAKGVKIPVRSLTRFDEKGQPVQQGWFSALTGLGADGTPSEAITRRLNK